MCYRLTELTNKKILLLESKDRLGGRDYSKTINGIVYLYLSTFYIYLYFNEIVSIITIFNDLENLAYLHILLD